MRNIRKFFCKRGFAVVTSLAMCASLILPSFAASFADLQAAVRGQYEGGAITVSEDGDERTVTLNESVVRDTESAVVIDSNTSVTIDLNGKTIDGSGTGGAVLTVNSGNTLTLIDSTAHTDEETGEYISGQITGGTNGGVNVNGGTFTMTGGTITGNTRGQGGGVNVNGGGSFTMIDGTISDNKATSNYGGGVYVQNGTFTMTGGTISDNTARSSGGGVGIKDASSSFIMTGGAISGNTANNAGGDGGGGGVWIKTDAKFTMSGGEITNNNVLDTNGGGNGGGVAIHQGIFKMEGGTIRDNVSPRGTGVLINAGSQNGDASFIMTGGYVKGSDDTSCIYLEEKEAPEGQTQYNASFTLSGTAVMDGTIFLGRGTQVITSNVQQLGDVHKYTGFSTTDAAGETPGSDVMPEQTETSDGYTATANTLLTIHYNHVWNEESWVPNGYGHSHPCTLCRELDSTVQSHRWGSWSAWSDDGNGSHSRTRTCTDCGAVDTETHSAEWSWTDNGDGTHTRTCSACHLSATAEHSWGSTWSQGNADGHTHACTACNAEETVAHSFDGWTENGDTHTDTCSVCDYSTDEPHNWGAFGDWVVSEDGKTQTKTQRCDDCSATNSVTENIPQKPEEPVVPPVTPEEPIVPPVTPEEPIVPPVTPEEPIVPPVTPEEPIVPSEPETPEVPVTPEEPDEEGPAVPSEDPDEEEPDDIVIDDTTIPLAPAPGIGAGAALPDEETELEEIELEDEIIPLSGLFTRADAIGYLWEKAGSPEAGLSDFEDVSEDHPWAVAIGWAQAMGIAVADEDGNFRPDDLLLRSVEDLEVDPEGEFQQFLNRYAVFAGVAEPGETFLKLEGEVDDIIMGEDAQVIFDEFFRLLEEEAAA